ncbi:hypothetical protein [Aromatoleum sp.]|uniref:hypothetical protein n=1 Tax=Aromatoleum sp. TaxID=2307007 RepID=UPI002FCC823B
MTTSVELRPFHIAFPVASLDDTRAFYFSDPCGNVVEFKAFRNPETRFLPFDENS